MRKQKQDKEEKLSIEGLLKEKKEEEKAVRSLETDYRKANVSEKSYNEQKEKLTKKIEELTKKIDDLERGKSGEKEEDTEESSEEETENAEKEKKSGRNADEINEEKSKMGFFKRIFQKKEKVEEEPEEEQEEVDEETEEKNLQQEEIELPEVEPPQVKQSGPTTIAKEQGEVVGDVEIEKVKVMIDTIREAKHVTDETIRTLSESIGEIRSMVFQADASIRESILKMEKIEDDLGEIKPQEIAKKFRETNDTTEKHQIILEKLERKTEDLADKINKVYDMLKGIGNIENISRISKDIQTKLDDINEAVRYIERLGSKTEKMFLDLSKGLEDLTIYRIKQEDLDDSLKEIIKSMDALNVKFEGYVSKKDMAIFMEDSVVMKKQIEDMNKILPVASVKLPETIVNLRKDREDILLFLDSLETQLKEGKISKEEYEGVLRINKKKLSILEDLLKKEWAKLEKILKITEEEKSEAEETTEKKTEAEPEKKAPATEEVKEERDKKPKKVEKGKKRKVKNK